MSRSRSTSKRTPHRSGGEVPDHAPTALSPSRATRRRVVEASAGLAGDETSAVDALRLVLVAESGFELPLVTSPAQAARLMQCARETDTAGEHGDMAPGTWGDPMVRLPRPVPVGQLLCRSRLVGRLETPLVAGRA